MVHKRQRISGAGVSAQVLQELVRVAESLATVLLAGHPIADERAAILVISAERV